MGMAFERKCSDFLSMARFADELTDSLQVELATWKRECEVRLFPMSEPRLLNKPVRSII